MRRFPLPPDWDGGPECVLGGRDAKRVSAVLRLGPGDGFPAIGPDGSMYHCQILGVARGQVRLSVSPSPAPGRAGEGRAGYDGPALGADTVGALPDGFVPLPDVRAGRGSASADEALRGLAPAGAIRTPLPRLTLAIGMLKGSGLDEVARAAAEAGVAEIVPLATKRSVPIDAARGRTERLRRVVAEALSQSGSGVATRVGDPARLADFLRARPSPSEDRVELFFHEAPLAHGSLHRYCSLAPREIVACVGPEGGFDESETAGLIEAGFRPAWLGPTVLRAETAAVFAIAALRVIFLERSSWSTAE